MKNILVLLLLVSGFSFSQEKTYCAKLENSAKFQENKVKGMFSFVFPEEISEEEIIKNAQFYTKNFTLTFNKKKHIVDLYLLENDVKNRQIIQRFLLSNHIKTIHIDKQELTINQFYNEYLK